MRKLAAVVVVALARVAAAEPEYTEPPLDSLPPPPPQPVPARSGERRIRVNIGLLVASPRGDIDDGSTETSPGFRGAIGYTLGAPELSVQILARHTYIRLKDAPSDASFSTTDLGLGGRYTIETPGSSVFGEVTICRSTFNADFSGFASSEDGLGFEFRAGVAIRLSDSLWLELAGSYLKAKITAQDDVGGDSALAVNWASAHLDLSLRL